MRVWRSLVTWAALLGSSLAPGCGLGPRSVYKTRLPYNEAVKVTSEDDDDQGDDNQGDDDSGGGDD